MNNVLLMFAIVALATAAEANLGQTPQEIEARYGKPSGDATVEVPATGAKTYQKNGLQITVQFWKDQSCKERYAKDPSNVMSDKEIFDLINANSSTSGIAWGGTIRKSGTTIAYERGDKKAWALATPADGWIEVFTSEWNQEKNRLKYEADKGKQ